MLSSMSNDEVERHGVASMTNGTNLSRSSTVSLAYRSRRPAIDRTDIQIHSDV